MGGLFFKCIEIGVWYVSEYLVGLVDFGVNIVCSGEGGFC